MALIKLRVNLDHKFLVSWYGVLKLLQLAFQINMLIVLVLAPKEVLEALSLGKTLLIAFHLAFLIGNCIIMLARIFFKLSIKVVFGYEIILTLGTTCFIAFTYLRMVGTPKPAYLIAVPFLPVHIYFLQTMIIYHVRKRFREEKSFEQSSVTKSSSTVESLLLKLLGYSNEPPQADVNKEIPLKPSPMKTQSNSDPPVSETSPDKIPVSETSPDKIPVSETSPDKIPVSETSPDKIPVSETSPDKIPVSETSPDKIPKSRLLFETKTENGTTVSMIREAFESGLDGRKIMTSFDVTTSHGLNLFYAKDSFFSKKIKNQEEMFSGLNLPTDVVSLVRDLMSG